MSEEIKKPKYKFSEYPEGVLIPGQPIKKNISKTMEVTEEFNVYDTMVYLAKMQKAIEDKEAEIEGLKAMKKAYEDELKLIEDELGIQKAQEEWEQVEAERIQKESEPIESPYIDEETNDKGDKESTS